MIQAYDDEDNAPMVMDLPLPYHVRTWEEIWKEGNEFESDTKGNPQEGEKPNKG